jgi:hypothetical protein
MVHGEERTDPYVGMYKENTDQLLSARGQARLQEKHRSYYCTYVILGHIRNIVKNPTSSIEKEKWKREQAEEQTLAHT